MKCWIVILTAFLSPLLCDPTIASQRQAVIVAVGAPGLPDYEQQFREWANGWQTAAKKANADFTLISTTAEAHNQLLEAIFANAEVSTEALWVVLIGHGTFDGRTASINLTGPDLKIAELAQALERVQRPTIVINCTSCSGPSLKMLSKSDRVIISATKDGSEIQFCRFGGNFSQAISGLEADIDQDGQTSLFEAWLFAARRTQQFYDSDNRIATEHSLLDDNGDGQGSRSESFVGLLPDTSIKNPEQLDGQHALRFCLVRSPAENRLSAEQRAKRNRLEVEIQLLRKRKHQFAEESEYLSELEKLFLPIARIYQAADTANR